MAVSIIWYIVIICVLIISHELGHFIIAKKNGIHVVEFYVGMGPALFSVTKGETKYSLRLLPIGGACVFEGEDGMNRKDAEDGEGSERELSPGAFPNASVYARFATVIAGPIFNFLLAYLCALIIVFSCGIYTPSIQSVSPGGAAEKAGIQAGDVITRIDGSRIHMWDEIRLAALTNRGEVMQVEYERAGVKNVVSLTPTYDSQADTWYLGVVSSGEVKQCNVPETFQYGFYVLKYSVKATYKSLLMLIKGKLSRDAVAGPVGMAKVVGDTYEAVKDYGTINIVLNMINIAMMLSISLGVMNLLPLPALDGGRLVFLLIEMVRGKPIPPEKEGMVHLGGMAALMVLMVMILINDISKFF